MIRNQRGGAAVQIVRVLLEPDRMYLNPEHIVFVEPVGEKSKVAQLIAQAH